MAIVNAILGGIDSNERAFNQSNTVFVEPDRAKAIALALSRADEGDVVIIAGKGHETTQEVKGVKHPFDDREIVRNFKGQPKRKEESE
jgi:UDP-N-acetylmuramoyl-L-alanyl-D-glutamate--2,6-diaminopimelate ligase